VRYDERGCGLSDSETGDLSVETWVGDLEAVVDAAGLDRFTLLGSSQGAAIAVAYAAEHPERVADLVLCGGYARGRQLRGQQQQEDALVAAIRAAWATDDPTFRRVFSSLFIPHGTSEQMACYEDLLRTCTTAESAVRLFEARGAIDVRDLAPQVRARCVDLARDRRQRCPRSRVGARAHHPRTRRRDRPALDGRVHAPSLSAGSSVVVRRRRAHAVLGGA
jgi:pimeloyl-ACP methyl ester carboxylesterase